MSEVQLEAATDRRRWWALCALAVSVLVVGLDLFVLSLALPTLAVSLHASTGDLQWFVDAYSLVLAAALLPPACSGTGSAARSCSCAPSLSSASHRWPAPTRPRPVS